MLVYCVLCVNDQDIEGTRRSMRVISMQGKGSYLGQPISFRIVPCPDIISRDMVNNDDDDMSALIYIDDGNCEKRKEFNFFMMRLMMVVLLVLDLISNTVVMVVLDMIMMMIDS